MKIYKKKDMPFEKFLQNVVSNVSDMLIAQRKLCNSEMIVIAFGVAAPNMTGTSGVSVTSGIMANGCEGVNADTVKTVALQAINAVRDCADRLDEDIEVFSE